MCLGCGVARVAWTDPRVDYCYSCLPGGPFTPPRCACGSGDYFSQGMCGRCHPGAPGYLGSCRDCQAWGVLRQHNWLCWSCRGWRRRYPVGQCPYCARRLPLGEMGACRGCYQQAFHFRDPGAPLDLLRANRFGRQLYLANLHLSRIRSGRRTGPPAPATPGGQGFEPVAQVQLALFDLAHDLQALSAAQPREPAMAEHCERVLVEHAAGASPPSGVALGSGGPGVREAASRARTCPAFNLVTWLSSCLDKPNACRPATAPAASDCACPAASVAAAIICSHRSSAAAMACSTCPWATKNPVTSSLICFSRAANAASRSAWTAAAARTAIAFTPIPHLLPRALGPNSRTPARQIVDGR
jgi:hypothetical protein